MVSLQQESQSMDRSQNRAVQGQPQRGLSETRKCQDTAAKVYPKGAYKREVSSKYEQTTRNAGNQKAKCFDKRPMLHGRNNERKTHSKLELDSLDVGFVSEKPKKRDITHWINLNSKPREEYDYEHPSPKVQKSYNINHVGKLIATEAHDYNKEEFLQANCQFVVRAGEDYSTYLVNQDKLVDWNFVEQVILHTVENNNCPICQEPPVAGKITRCGHVLCSVCVLRYSAVTGRSWAKCPICSESIHDKDVKSVKVLVRKGPSVGQEVMFQLMRREMGSMVITPVSEVSDRSPSKLLSVNEDVYSTVYSKLLQANTKEIMQILDEEENSLKEQLKEYEGTPELLFVEEAIENLRERKETLLAISVVDEEDTSATELDEQKLFVTDDEALSVSVGDESKTADVDHQMEEGDLKTRNTNVQSPQKKFCFFYQAMDGQRIFLHSLNIKMLETEFGSLERCPHFLTGVILEKDYGSMTLKLRKRLRYLQHLPVTSEFEIVELDLPKDVISPSVALTFRDQLQERSKIRAKRMKDEMNRERKMRIANMQKAEFELGMIRYVEQPTKRYRLNSLHEFPECGADTPPFASSSGSSNGSIGDNDDFPALVQSVDSLSLNNNTFAQKLKDGRKSTRSAESRDFEEAGPSHAYCLGDAVEAALQMASNNQGVVQKRGGKKKKKKSVSISTSGIIGRIGN